MRQSQGSLWLEIRADIDKLIPSSRLVRMVRPVDERYGEILGECKTLERSLAKYRSVGPFPKFRDAGPLARFLDRDRSSPLELLAYGIVERLNHLLANPAGYGFDFTEALKDELSKINQVLEELAKYPLQNPELAPEPIVELFSEPMREQDAAAGKGRSGRKPTTKALANFANTRRKRKPAVTWADITGQKDSPAEIAKHLAHPKKTVRCRCSFEPAFCGLFFALSAAHRWVNH
jgi:hypothetical protein